MKKSVFYLKQLIPLLLMLSVQYGWGATRFPVHAIEYPPFVTSDVANPGITVALLNRLISPHEAVVDIQLLPPARLQSALNDRDFLASLVEPEIADDDILEFRYAGEAIYRRMFRRKGVEREFSDMTGATVARLGFLFRDAENDTTVMMGGIPVAAPNFESAVRMLMAERVDFILGVDEAILTAARDLGVEDQIEPSPEVMQTFARLVLYVNSDHPKARQFIEVLNRTDGLSQDSADN